MRGFKILGGAMALLIGTAANAQVFEFPPQNPNGARGAYEQVNYPYPGQCQANPAASVVWGVPACTTGPTGNAKSFDCPAGAPTGVSNFTAGGWRTCGAGPVGFNPLQLNPVFEGSKFIQPFLNPFDYFPDTTTFPGADFYDLGLHESWGYQNLANLSTFGVRVVPQPLDFGSVPVPNGMQWTGLLCNVAGGCTCPAELETNFRNAYCSGAGSTIPFGNPIFTPIWGIGQRTGVGPVVGGLLGVATITSPWSANNYVATWPSVSIRANKGRPVVVRWTNEFPNNHTFCPHPEAADWPCAIDRTFMGVKATIDPAATPGGTAGGSGFGYNAFANTASVASPFKVNQFGGAQQPDNSWVTHLHGGDIPPATDGFAEKWYGNAVSGAVYSPTKWFLTPAFESPLPGALFRPGESPTRAGNAYPAQAWNADTYTYPMDQEEALIWFHDHTLGKTHHNVIAGPAGFFPVRDPAKHGAVDAAGACIGDPTGAACEFTWLDPVTLPKFDLGSVQALANAGVPTGVVLIPKYDFFMAIQDRAFNDDGSINFSNGLGNVPQGLPPEITYVTPGDNALVHPVWLPEYFGDHVLVNGILWPQANVEPGVYRIRMANGSDSRCYTMGLSTQRPASGARPLNNVGFTVIASDQGYVPVPRNITTTTPVTFCPGERLELLVNFEGRALNSSIYLTNSAAAPFPAGESPFLPGGPFPDTNVIMSFRVGAATASTVPSCGAGGLTSYDPAAANPGVGCVALPNGSTNHNADPDIAAYRNIVLDNAVPRQPKTAIMCSGPNVVEGTPVPGVNCVSAVRQLYLNERVDGTTGAPLGMQINGVPFEYKVTETPKRGTIEVWEIINLTVDAHPMHPHLVKHLRVGRHKLNVGAYKTALCGSTTCQPGPAPGNEMPVIPDVRNLFGVAGNTALGAFTAETGNVFNSWKDASQVLPGEMTTIIAKWDGGYHAVLPNKVATSAAVANTPGSAGFFPNTTTPRLAGDIANCPGPGAPADPTAGCVAANWRYEPVSSGPFVWHCHINSHEDSEMMRTSLVVE
jgi:FtsP/CotA-like multicopper oxidase with cupredoxin domain